MLTDSARSELRVIAFGGRHPFMPVVLRVVDELPGFTLADQVKGNDEREFLREPNSDRARAHLASLEPDLFISAGYGRILEESTLAIPRIGCLNIHPSLLPRLRGRDAVHWALYERDERVGVTIHEMTAAVDSGSILAQRSIPLRGDEEPREVYDRLAELLPEMLRAVLEEIRATNAIVGAPQTGTASRRRSPSDEAERLEIDWSLPADELLRRFRVFPRNCNVRAGRWRVFVKDMERLPPDTRVRRRLATVDVVAGDGVPIRLHLADPLRARVKLALTRFR